MPQLVPSAIAGIGIGLGSIGADIALFGLSFKATAALLGFSVFALGTASSLLQQNRASYEQRLGGLLVSQRASVTPARILYGNVRVGGPITAMFTSDWLKGTPVGASGLFGLRRKQNAYLHLIITLSWLDIEEVLTVFLDDYPIHLQSMVDSSGRVNVGKRYYDSAGQTGVVEWPSESALYTESGDPVYDQDTLTTGKFNVQIQVHTGSSDGIADLKTWQPFPDLSTRVPEWTLDHKQAGRAKIYVRLLYDPDDRGMWPNGIPNITAYVRGHEVVDTRDSTTAYSPNPSLILRNQLRVPRKAGGLAINSTAGSDVIEIDEDSFIAAANDSDEEVAVNTTLNSARHRELKIYTGDNFTYLDEVTSPSAYTYFPAILDNNVNGQGVDINTGDKVSIAGTALQIPTEMDLSEQYYIILKGIGRGLSNRDISDLGGDGALTTDETRQFYQVGFATTYLNAIRDVPIQNVSPNGGGAAGPTATMGAAKVAEVRYQCAAVVELDRPPQDFISDILSSMGARLIYSGGKFSLASYEYFTPTISYDESDLRKPFQVQTKVSRRNRFNIVKGLYTAIIKLGRSSSYPAAKRTLHITNDNNEELTREFNFPNTPSQTMAQRLAKIELEKHRQEIVVTLPLTLAGFLSKAGDNIQLSLSDMGWTNKVFEILEWMFLIDQDSEGNPIVGVDVVAKETASAIWDWDETQDERDDDFADDTDLADGSFIAPPTNLSITESKFTSSASSFVQVRLTLNWNDSLGPYLKNYEVQYKRSTDTEYQSLAPTEATTKEINDVETAVLYDIRVRAVNTLDTPSEWLSVQHDVFGLSDRPGNVQNCNVVVVGIVALVTIDPTVDDDVRLGGKILTRHDKATVGGDWINSVSIFSSTSSGELNENAIVSGQKTQFFVPIKTGTYLFKFQDSAGFTSETASSCVLENFSTDGFKTLATITENPAFAGTHSNTTVNDGTLRLELYSDVSPSVEVISSGTYTFGNSFNFGARKKVRITSTIGVTITAVGDTIDSRTDNIDTWADFDGVLGSDADAQMFIRYITTDPTVSPTPSFGAWQSIQTSGEFDIWAAEFKVELSSFNPSANIHIDTLSMLAEEKLAL
jgi:hypothetical protein